MRVAPRIILTDEERTMLNVWLHLQTSARLRLRAKIILLAADGQTNQEIACQLGASRKTVSLWRQRFLKGRLTDIEREAPRSKQKSKVYEATARLILRKMKERPANGTRWTTRSLAKELKISPSLVYRVWQDYGLASPQEQLSRLQRGVFLLFSCAATFLDDAVFLASEILS